MAWYGYGHLAQCAVSVLHSQGGQGRQGRQGRAGAGRDCRE